MGYIAYILDSKSRRELENKFPPKFSRFIGHHITYKFGVNSTYPLPKNTENIKVVGYSVNDNGLEALVVSLNGKVNRADGSFYHITWSLEPSKFKPVDSNNLIKSKGYIQFDNPIKIKCSVEFLK